MTAQIIRGPTGERLQAAYAPVDVAAGQTIEIQLDTVAKLLAALLQESYLQRARQMALDGVELRWGVSQEENQAYLAFQMGSPSPDQAVTFQGLLQHLNQLAAQLGIPTAQSPILHFEPPKEPTEPTEPTETKEPSLG